MGALLLALRTLLPFCASTLCPVAVRLPPPQPLGQRLSPGRRQGWARRTSPASARLGVGVSQPPGWGSAGAEASGASLPAGSQGTLALRLALCAPHSKAGWGAPQGSIPMGRAAGPPTRAAPSAPATPPQSAGTAFRGPVSATRPQGGQAPGVPGLGRRLRPPAVLPAGRPCPAGLGLVLSGAPGPSPAERVRWPVAWRAPSGWLVRAGVQLLAPGPESEP